MTTRKFARIRARITRAFQLPLLAKELREQASRRRTYVIRFLYGGFLFAASLVLFYGGMSFSGDMAGILGRGRWMFDWLVYLQFWGIVLFLPAMACGTLTAEKEAGSLGLLLVTSLSPWQIVVQKLVSRLVPVVTFLFLSFPLMAVAYSYGGVNEDRLWSGILTLLSFAVMLGSLAVACSAFFRTTTEAFIATYAILLVLGTCCVPVFGFAGLAGGKSSRSGLVEMEMLVLTLLCLIVARVVLLDRAFLPPRNALLQLFRHLDGFWEELNQVTGGVVLVADSQSLPGQEPIAWRETAKKSLGTFRYLFRVLVVLELPALYLAVSFDPDWSGPGAVAGYLQVLWAVAAAFVAVHGAGLISSERSRLTLDVLLAAPLSGREIILQKFRGVRRLMLVFFVPFLTLFFLADYMQGRAIGPTLSWSLLSLVVYLPLAAWLSMWIGFRFKSHIRAVAVSILLVAVWAALPALSRYLLGLAFSSGPPEAARWLMLLSPASTVFALSNPESWMPRLPQAGNLFFAVNFALYGGLLVLLRQRLLRRADKYLGRVGGDAMDGES